jgi:putative NADH-flavin reductase
MKLTVFGATGGTGNEVVKQALEVGHEVTSFVRDASRLSVRNEKLRIITGDVFDADSVSAAVQGQDAVVCALGSGQDLKKTNIRTTGTQNIIHAMKQHNIKRLVVVTAMGVGESWETLSFINKFFFAVVLRNSRKDHEAQEAAVINCGLDWTIIRPSGLTDTPRTGKYNEGENISARISQISRADVADLILKELKENKRVRKAVTITNQESIKK